MIRTSTRTGNSREAGIKCSPCGPRPSCFSYVTCAGELRCRFIKWSARNMTAKEANRSYLQATLRYSLTEGLPTIHLQPDMASHIAVSGPQTEMRTEHSLLAAARTQSLCLLGAAELRKRKQNLDILPSVNGGDSYRLYRLAHTMPSVGS